MILLLRVLRQRARSLFRTAKVDAELENELAFHLDQLTQEFVASGMDAREARLAARRALGGVALLEEQCRDQRRIGWFTDLEKDVAYAWRMLRKSPGFTALAALTLAFGVGASIAVYALAESLLLRSLPYASPERLAAIYSVHVRRGFLENIGQDNFRDWQAQNTVFERMAFTEWSQMTLTGRGDAERLSGLAVSEGFFEMLGVPARLGRWFTPEEQKPGADRVVLLSDGFWKRKLGGRPDIAGATIYLNDQPYRIAGVMPETFRFNQGFAAEYWTPVSDVAHGRSQHQYMAYGRLKPGVPLEAAQAQMEEIGKRLERAYPENMDWGVRVASMRAQFLESFGPALQLFGAAALIVMLVACANVASLLLARGVGRGKEVAVRIALGASRARVVRLLLTETLLLSCLSCAAGLLLAGWLLQLAIAVAPPWLELRAMVSVSPALVIFVVALTLLTGLLTGIWPALRASRANLQHDLKEGGSALMAGRQQQRALNSLVLVEIALAVVLLTFAGLLARSLGSLLDTELGYRTDHLMTFRMSPPSSRYPSDAAKARFWNALLPRLAALPGVVSAAAADGIPLGGSYNATGIQVEGRPAPRDWTDLTSRTSGVTPDYFRTMGIPLRVGRGFGPQDTAGSEPVVLVNEAFVRMANLGPNPLEKRVRLGGEKWLQVVGIIGDLRYGGPMQSTEPEAYLPFTQSTWLEFVVLRTAVPEQAILNAARDAVREVDPAIAITQVRTMKESIALATALPREMMALVAGFAGVTLAMATLGLAGVMVYMVSRRKREIGLRMALGARSGDISRTVIWKAGKLVVLGAAIGVVCALASARVLESLLYGVRPHDPFALAAAPAILAAIALAACVWPARRAASIDPMDALRQE